MKNRLTSSGIVFLGIFSATGPASAEADCFDNLAAQVGKMPDVVFPQGKVSCISVIPARFRDVALSTLHNGNCGVYVSVKSGAPHIGLREGATIQSACTATNFFPATANEIANSVSPGGVKLNNSGFTVFSDGTLPSGSAGTIEFRSRVGTDLSQAKYTIGSFNYFIAPSGTIVSDTAFTHTVAIANNPVESHSIISHPLLDGQPNASPLLTAVENFGAGNFVDNNHPTAIVYGIDLSDHWSIVNLDGGALLLGAQFNVEAAPPSDYGQYAVPSDGALSFPIASVMDYNSSALLFPTSLSTGNPRVPTTYFNLQSNQWVIFSADRGILSPGALYGLRFIGAPDLAQYIFSVVATSDNTNAESLFLDNSFGLNSTSRIFVSPVSTVWAPSVPGIWWTGGGWAIYNEDWAAMPIGAQFNVYWHRPALLASPTRGDLTADKKADIAIIGGSISSMPVAASVGDGSFALPTKSSDPNFPVWAQTSGAKALPGDFDGDGRTDIALTGVNGWITVPVAFSMGDGTFRVTNGMVGTGDEVSNLASLPQAFPPISGPWDTNFTAYAAATGAKPIAGDFNGDGVTDIALLGAMNAIPVAFSRGEGTFAGKVGSVTSGFTNFASAAMQSGVKIVAGDFDGDGRCDIGLTGGLGWTTVPVAFSNGDGTFRATNAAVATIPALTAASSSHALVGDFDGDGKADIVVCGNASDSFMHYALSNGDGTFRQLNSGVTSFVNTGCFNSVKAFTGDFDGNGTSDIGVIWTTLGPPRPPFGVRKSTYILSVGLVGPNGAVTESSFATPADLNSEDVQSLAQRFGAIPFSASRSIR